MTQRQLRHQKLTQAWVTTHENCKPGAHCTGSIRTGWGVSFLHATVHLSLFQIAPLVSIFKYLSWSEVLLGILACLEMYLSCLHCFYMRGKWGNYLLNLVSFRNFLKPLSCLLPELKELFQRMKKFTSPQNILLFHLHSNTLHLKLVPSKTDSFNVKGNCLIQYHFSYFISMIGNIRWSPILMTLLNIIFQSSHGQIPSHLLLRVTMYRFWGETNIQSIRHSNGSRESAFCFKMCRSRLLYRHL